MNFMSINIEEFNRFSKEVKKFGISVNEIKIPEFTEEERLGLKFLIEITKR